MTYKSIIEQKVKELLAIAKRSYAFTHMYFCLQEGDIITGKYTTAVQMHASDCGACAAFINASEAAVAFGPIDSPEKLAPIIGGMASALETGGSLDSLETMLPPHKENLTLDDIPYYNPDIVLDALERRQSDLKAFILEDPRFEASGISKTVEDDEEESTREEQRLQRDEQWRDMGMDFEEKLARDAAKIKEPFNMPDISDFLMDVSIYYTLSDKKDPVLADTALKAIVYVGDKRYVFPSMVKRAKLYRDNRDYLRGIILCQEALSLAYEAMRQAKGEIKSKHGEVVNFDFGNILTTFTLQNIMMSRFEDSSPTELQQRDLYASLAIIAGVNLCNPK